MSIFPATTLKVLAEAAGVANLPDDVANAVAPDVEYRLREVIQDAAKFMHHAKRTRMTADDVNRALRVRNVEPLFGFSATEPLRYRKVPGAGVADVYYLEDDELDCNELINAPIPRVPLEVSYTSHWLAIEGVQPAIPQNPPPLEAAADGETAATAAGGPASLVLANGVKAPEGLALSDPAAAGAQVTPLVKHVLTKEMQLYYEKIVSSIVGPDAATRKQVLLSLQSDPGIHQLLPYLVQFIIDKIAHNMKNLELLTTMLSMIDALLENTNLFLEPYLHQLMPAVLTCLLGRQLCRSTTQEDHWSLRDAAARIVRTVCRNYGNAYYTLEARVTKTLLKALLDPSKPLTTHYGAIVGLASLGYEVIRMLLLPNLKVYSKLLAPLMRLDPRTDTKSFEATRCFEALLNATGTFMRQAFKETSSDALLSLEDRINQALLPGSGVTYDDVVQVFGSDRLAPFIKGGQSA